MPRQPRIEVVGGIQHVWVRGNNRMRLFHDAQDALRYLAALAHVLKANGWRLLAYCLMPNHVHLVIETPEANLGAGMRWLQTDYATHYNRRYSHCGHVFQGRFGSKVVTDDVHLWTLVGYVVLNPVKARLCARPEAWEWSSHAAVVSGDAPAWVDDARLLEFYETQPGNGREQYARMVESQLALGCPGPSPAPSERPRATEGRAARRALRARRATATAAT